MKRITTYLWMIAVLTACSNNENTSDAYGSFEAVDVIVSAEGQGRILSFEAREGSKLEPGTVIGVIDTSQLHLKKQQVLASIGAIRTRYGTIDAQSESYRVQLENLDRELRRVKSLLEDGAATRKQLDDLEGNIALVGAQLTALEAQKATVRAEEQSAAAELARVKDQIEKSAIENPISGTVLEKYKEAGEIVAAGQALYKIADTGSLILRAYISGNQLTSVKIGDAVTVRLDGPDGLREMEGVVSWIADEAEFTPKIIQTREERVNLVYAMKVVVENDGSLKIGMPGEIKFR